MLLIVLRIVRVPFARLSLWKPGAGEVREGGMGFLEVAIVVKMLGLA